MIPDRKAQSSVDYLSTYVYGAIALLAVVGALAYFGAFNQQNYAKESCESGEQLQCSDAIGYTDGDFKVDFKNNLAREIIISEAIAHYGDLTITNDYASSPLSIPPKSSTTITFSTGQNLKRGSKESIDYTVTFEPAGSTNSYTVAGNALVEIANKEQAQAVCGDGKIDEIIGEECDGDDLGGMTCGGITILVDGTFITPYTGDYLSCDQETCRFNTMDCGIKSEYCSSIYAWKASPWPGDFENERCCDGPGKFIKEEPVYVFTESPSFNRIFADDDSTQPACCDSYTDCTYNNECYNDGTATDLNYDGDNELCVYGMWLECKVDSDCPSGHYCNSPVGNCVSYCGNGIWNQEQGEVCDPTSTYKNDLCKNLDAQSFKAGTATCTPSCIWSYVNCELEACGSQQLERTFISFDASFGTTDHLTSQCCPKDMTYCVSLDGNCILTGDQYDADLNGDADYCDQGTWRDCTSTAIGSNECPPDHQCVEGVCQPSDYIID